MILKIERFKSGSDYTIGSFILFDENNNQVLKGFTLEPAGNDEVKPNLDKRIPEGKYNAQWEFSPRFKRHLPVLSNERVSAKRRILIHTGNNGDHTSGCILLGKNYVDDRIFNSMECFKEFCELVKEHSFKVVIKNQIKS